jgi:plasmid stability protein
MRTVQIRNVPDDLYRKLEARAADAGKSLSEYLLDEFRRLAEKPTTEELMRRAEKKYVLDVVRRP